METNLTRLRHIVAVARTRSFSLAASEAAITQPALSRSIQAFEQQHGVRLFDRGRGGVSLTVAGALVVDQARSMLAAAGELDRSLRLYGKGEAGRIGVGLGPLMASMLLPTLAASLLRSRPHVQIVSMIRAPDQLIDSLLNDSIDMIIGNRWHLAQAFGIAFRQLAALPLAHAVRADHPLAGKAQISAAELAAWPMAGAIDLQIRSLPPTCGAFVCDNFHILRDVVAQTDCVWLTAPAFLRAELAASRLCLLDICDQDANSIDICVAWRRGRTPSPAALALIEEARALLANVGAVL